MKLHRLELEGFGPFHARQVVDFDAFDGDGIFLIAGRTGAGKSSILDGVGFALYGEVPRYEGVAKRLRSDFCAPGDRTEVQLEFTVGDRRWRVTRSPEYERPKKSGTGFTTEGHRAIVEELVDGVWIGRAARPREAGELLGEVLGLSREQFQQVILLAQNRFAEFLLAGNDDRQALLRTLFGSRTYAQYEQALDQRRRDAETAVAGRLRELEVLVGEAERTVGSHGFGSDVAAGAGGTVGPEAAAGPVAQRPLADRLDELDRATERGTYRVTMLADAHDAAVLARDAAVAAHTELTQVHERAAERARARDGVAALDARSAEIDAARTDLARARRAEALRAPLQAADRAAAIVDAARTAEAAARTAWTQVDGSPTSTAAELDALIDEVTGHLAVWAAAAEQERALSAVRDERERCQVALAEAEQQAAELETERTALPARRRTIEEEHAAADRLAATGDDARAALAEAQARREAAGRVEALRDEVDAAQRAQLAAAGAAADAAVAATTLLRRRVQERAGALAGELVDGEPCAVCGSTAHPHPAEPSADAVTDDELAAADEARDRAHAAATTATEATSTLRAARAAAAALAGGLDVPAADEVLEAAAGRAAAAAQAAQRAAALGEQRSGIDRRSAELEEQIAALRTTRAALREQAATLTERITAATSAVQQARGEFATVALRVQHAQQRRAAAIALRDAIAALTAAAAAAADAAADRDQRVAASDFDDAAAAAAALRTDAERTELDDRVQAHTTALAVQKARLLELELALVDAPDPLPSREASAAAMTAARDQVDASVTAAAEAHQAVASLTALGRRARAAHGEIADLEAQRQLVAGLANAVAGRNERKMDLETFVLAAELEQIVTAANLRLDEMSSGRYRLAHTDALAARRGASGLGLEVVDAYTGQARPAQSLSGGETFLASLALALGLAQVVTDRAGGIRLDTLFIDEGFGSLDPETLDLAMRTLDELRQGGRTVGVISHVEAMKEQLPAQLLVVASRHGPSTVQQRAFDPA
ncbi:hypothetical protein GCM10022240_17190 [Microbacterium kribbense]|uniref:Nuclease SbcCD subunit C n=1 Tax=Microbacterium kribbense TaxID=433645 RepID=A0ABP7GIM1_9MICO